MVPTKKIIRKKVVSQPSQPLKYKTAQPKKRNPFLALLGHFSVLGVGLLVGDIVLNRHLFELRDLLIYPIIAVPNAILYPWFLYKAFTADTILWQLTAAFWGYGFSSICFWYRFSPRFSLTVLNVCTFIGGIAMIVLNRFFVEIQ